ncbi:MAG: DUF488 family protein [Deltaproteobacteria bacterium]|nr:DUF488 family protein [Deltaproteobacteria bacterium]
MIKTKSVYDKEEEENGIRVLVTRFWPRGVRKEEQDFWMKDLGPEAWVIKKWKAGEMTWDAFKREYREEFKKDERKRELLHELKVIIKSAKKRDVTLLCTCREDEHCHRTLLKEMLVKGGI